METVGLRQVMGQMVIGDHHIELRGLEPGQRVLRTGDNLTVPIQRGHHRFDLLPEGRFVVQNEGLRSFASNHNGLHVMST